MFKSCRRPVLYIVSSLEVNILAKQDLTHIFTQTAVQLNDLFGVRVQHLSFRTIQRQICVGL